MINFPEFFQDLKQRISSPFFSSFIISWLIINWKITIALLFYSDSMIKSDGYLSYNDLIRNCIDSQHGIVWPLYSSLLYTLAFPFCRNLFSAVGNWFTTWGTTWDLAIAKKGKVPMQKYFELRNKYQERSKQLEDVLANEPDRIKTITDLQKQLSEVDIEKQKLISELKSFKVSQDISVLNGFWKTHNFLDKEEDEVLFNNGSIEKKHRTSNQLTTYILGNIVSFYIDEDFRKLFFIVQNKDKISTYLFKYLPADLSKLYGDPAELSHVWLERTNQ